MTAQSMETNTAPASAPSPEIALMNMLHNMEELSELYVAELDAMEIRDMKKFADLQPAKNRLVRDCEIRLTEITRDTSLLRSLAPEIKAKVYTTESHLRELALKSQRICKIRSETMRRVQNRLLDAARHIMMADQRNYDSKGKSGLSSKSKPIATAINEAI